ncbi:MAG: hypothetical protein CME64_11170 [Halobacteriovoraceae bacterium]|nr:hypothetical protein [Halobacteriovoraceae bacterium]|tara:strand:- start:162165 stop:162926 length:762 start_codon:yes stop_codon:yes gene_type:complete
MKNFISSIAIATTLLSSTHALSSESFCKKIYESEVEEVTQEWESHNSFWNQTFNYKYGSITILFYTMGVSVLSTSPHLGFTFGILYSSYAVDQNREIDSNLSSQIESASTISAILEEAHNGKEEFIKKKVDVEASWYKASLEYEYERLVDKRAKVGLPAPTFEEFMADNQYKSVEQYREEKMVASYHVSPIERFAEEYEGKISYGQIAEYIKAYGVSDKFCPENKVLSYDDFVKTIGNGVSKYSSSNFTNEVF